MMHGVHIAIPAEASITTMRDNGTLCGKTAIVTGGGSGLGRAIATALGLAGANVVVCGRRSEACEETCHQLSRQGVKAVPVKCDVGEPAHVERLVETALARFGQVNILVNNAGTPGAATSLLEMSLEAWERTLRVNLTGVMLCSQAVARHMVTNGGGKIINIASVGAMDVLPRSADYCASKSAVVHFTKAMALEMASHRIQVNVICPGYFATEFAPEMLASAKESAKKWIPSARLGDPTEVAGLAVYLASSASDYIVGSSFVIDGGYLLR